jgi:hypothetical protein
VQVASLVVLPANPGLLAMAPLQQTVALVERPANGSWPRPSSTNVEQGATEAAKAEDVGVVLMDLDIPAAPTIRHLPQFSAAFDRQPQSDAHQCRTTAR